MANNHVATNCHVIANAKEIAILKLGKSFTPIGIKADWNHDICLLVFDRLPLTPPPLKRLNINQHYEEPVIAFGFSGSSPKPTRAFGNIKAVMSLDDSYIIETSSGFTLGASGGALMSYQGNYLALPLLKVLAKRDITLVYQLNG